MLKTKILLPLLITFSSLFGASKFLVSNPNLNSFNLPQTSSKSDLPLQNLSTTENQSIASFSNDESNLLTISVTEKYTDSNIQINKKEQSFEIFTTPSEKYLGYYLKKYFNVTPLVFVNLPPDKQQLYTDYIETHPAKEYLENHQSSLQNNSLPKKSTSTLEWGYFHIEWIETPWTFKIYLSEKLVATVLYGLILVGNVISFTLSGGTTIELNLALVEIASTVYYYILNSSYSSTETTLTKRTTEDKVSFNYKNFILSSSATTTDTFRKDTINNFARVAFEINISHPVFIGYKKIWFIKIPIWGWKPNYIYPSNRDWFQEVIDSKEFSEKNPNSWSTTKNFSNKTLKFDFSFANYTPDEILEILRLNSSETMSTFNLPKDSLSNYDIELNNLDSTKKHNYKLFSSSYLEYYKGFPYFFNSSFSISNNKFNAFHLGKTVEGNNKSKLLEHFNTLKARETTILLHELKNHYLNWLNNPSPKNKKTYLSNLKRLKTPLRNFTFHFAPDGNNSFSVLMTEIEEISALSFKSFSPSTSYSEIRSYSDLLFLKSPNQNPSLNSFLGEENEISFIIFDKNSPQCLQFISNGNLISNHNTSVLNYLLFERPYFELNSVELNFLDWYGNIEILNTSTSLQNY